MSARIGCSLCGSTTASSILTQRLGQPENKATRLSLPNSTSWVRTSGNASRLLTPQSAATQEMYKGRHQKSASHMIYPTDMRLFVSLKIDSFTPSRCTEPVGHPAVGLDRTWKGRAANLHKSSFADWSRSSTKRLITGNGVDRHFGDLET